MKALDGNANRKFDKQAGARYLIAPKCQNSFFTLHAFFSPVSIKVFPFANLVRHFYRLFILFCSPVTRTGGK